MPLGNNQFAAKLKYLQRGGGCCKKKGKKVDKIDMMKNPLPPIFFSLKRGYFDQNLPEESEKKWSRCSTTTIFCVDWEFLLKKD